MSDWTDEVRDRLLAPSTVSGTWGAPEDGPWCVKREAYIRAALGEIERRGLQYPDDLGISRDAAGLSARCAELRDRLVAQGKRAEAAEADRDEWRETARSEMAGRRAAEAEVERLRAALTGIINVQDDQTIWPAYSNEKGKRMDAAIDHARAALRGGGE